jgi:hypothetical protein
VTRPPLRRPGDAAELEERAGVPAPASPVQDVLALQRSAGNAAVARVLAREPVADAPVANPIQLPGVGSDRNPFAIKAPELAPDVERAVDAYLRNQKPGILTGVQAGTISMPEVIDQVRRSVPEAASAKAEAIGMRVGQIVGEVPWSRTKADLGGQKKQREASIANLFPKVPTSVDVGWSSTKITVSVSGAELKTAADGAHITGKADQEGAEAEVKKGDFKAGVEGKWDGSSFGVKTEVGPVKFSAGVKHSGDKWSWNGGLTFQLAGDEVDELPDVGTAVIAANGALTDSLGHLMRGGSPTDSYITGRMGQIKPAIDAAGKIAARSGKSGATLRVTASGEDGGFTAGISLVIVF